MTLRIADLCLGTDKDWKVGKTKIFLKVRCCEVLLPLASWDSKRDMGKRPSLPHLLRSSAGLWVPLAIDSCTSLPHSGHLGARQEGGKQRDRLTEGIPQGDHTER